MKTKTEFTIVHAETRKDFVQRVTKHLADGWKFHGPAMYIDEIMESFNQPMVREVSVPTVEGYEVRD